MKMRNIFINEERVKETIILAPKIFTEIHRGLSSIPMLGWKRNR
jgi:hypothetical protein